MIVHGKIGRQEAAMTIQVKFASKASGQLEGALTEPAGSGKAAGLVVVQEWHGLNTYMKAVCDRFAQNGFLALAPDLFHGQLATTQEQAAHLMRVLDKKKAVAEIADAKRFLEDHARCNGKIGVVGFCMGGALAFQAARYVDGLAAVVALYGLPDMPIDEFAKVRVPIQAHFGKKDDWAKASVAEEIHKKVRSGGCEMELHVYDAGHAFARWTDPQVYDAESTKLAWDRTVDFLKKRLS
jgi:carboxymethylenebutenolidase